MLSQPCVVWAADMLKIKYQNDLGLSLVPLMAIYQPPRSVLTTECINLGEHCLSSPLWQGSPPTFDVICLLSVHTKVSVVSALVSAAR